MKIIPSVPTHALNLCSVAACGAAERIAFDSNRWISRCELTVCYHRWMQWWKNDVGNNLLALQKSYGLCFALIKRHLFLLYCVIRGYVTGMLLWKCANPTFTHTVDDLGRSFSSLAVACMKNNNIVAYVVFCEVIGLVTHVLTDMRFTLTVFFENMSPLNSFK